MAETPENDAAVSRSVVAPAWLLTGLKAISAASICALMLMIFSDVVMRYFFNSPLRGVYEISGLLLGMLTMSALPLVTEQREHVTVDLIDGYLHGAVRFVMQLLVLVFQMVMIGFIAWRIYALALREWQSGWVTVDLQISRAPVLFAIAFFAALTAALVGIMIIQFMRRRLPVVPIGGFNHDADNLF